MVIDGDTDAVRWFGLVESVKLMVGVRVPAMEGVPEITPEELMERPLGSPVADHV